MRLYYLFNNLSYLKKIFRGNSLMVQWLELCTFTSETLSSISGQGTKISQATWHNENRKSSVEI